MTRKHGPDAFVVLLEDGGAVATVGPFKEQEEADAFIDREVQPKEAASRQTSTHYHHRQEYL
tara:strand:+ start:546 stop:731 length:186 start_codon:yes stop_codon:yes gene_type:complete